MHGVRAPQPVLRGQLTGVTLHGDTTAWLELPQSLSSPSPLSLNFVVDQVSELPLTTFDGIP